MDILETLFGIAKKLDPKDWITLTASLSALVFSIITYRQKSSESKIALRKQLTEILEKLSELNIENAMFRLKREEYPQNYAGLLGDKRRFLVRQANFLIRSVGELVSPYEYLLVAGAFDDINDTAQAEYYFKLAIAASADHFDKGIALRGYARYLFNLGSTGQELARTKYKEAVKTFSGDSDRYLNYLADTYVRWGRQELEWKDKAKARLLFQQAADVYGRLANPERRAERLAEMAELIDSTTGTTEIVPAQNAA